MLSAVIDRPVDEVWQALRTLDRIGAAGGAPRKQTIALSDRDYAMTTHALEGPASGQVRTLRLRRVTDGERTLLTWDGAEEKFRTMLAALRVGSAQPAARAAPAGSATAVRITRHGGPDVLRAGTQAVPAAKAGEVRIRHAAIGVNYVDVYCRTGLFDLVPAGGVPGLEAAGTVVDTAVPWLRPGDRVAYACLPPGAYATERTMPADLVLPLPDDVTTEVGASLLLKGMTAAFLLHAVHPLRANQVVLIHAAAGGTGLLLCQWARALGATVIGVVSSEAKAGVARAHGCAYPLVTGQQDIAAAVRDLSQGRGADVVYDGVGAASLETSFEALAVRGHLISFGQASGEVPPQDISAWAAKSATVSRPNFGHYTGTRAEAQHLADMVWDGLRRGILRAPEATRFSLADAADAHRALESRATTGPLILIP